MHWYDRKGRPKYEIEKLDGSGMRATTLRDARKLSLVPSVTTVIDVISKPALEYWKTQQLLNAVEDNHEKLRASIKSNFYWKFDLINESKKSSSDAAALGTSIHDALEKYYLNRPYNRKFKKHVEETAKLIESQIPDIAWSPERSFCHPAGYGGKTDLSSSEGSDCVVLDFKTKSKDDLDGKLAYDEHCMQLAAYRLGLDMPEARCYNLFISTTVPGLVKLHEWSEEEIKRGEEMFLTLLKYWKLSCKYDSGE